MSAAKKLNPKKAVCKHEGCFESPSTRGFCRLHFLNVLKGKAEGDQKPRANLRAVPDDIPRRRPKLMLADAEVGSVDETFASNEADRLGEIDMDLDLEEDLEIPTISWSKRPRKAS